MPIAPFISPADALLLANQLNKPVVRYFSPVDDRNVTEACLKSRFTGKCCGCGVVVMRALHLPGVAHGLYCAACCPGCRWVPTDAESAALARNRGQREERGECEEQRAVIRPPAQHRERAVLKRPRVKDPIACKAGNGFKKKWDTDPAFRKRMTAVLRRATAKAAARRGR
jgi:hypothetical protein